MTAVYQEKDIKRSIGWLIVAIATLIDSIMVFLEGRMIAYVFIFGISFVDFFLFYYWRNKYRELKEKDKKDKRIIYRERFLNDIINKRR